MEKILIADDDEGVLMLYSAALERAGYEVLTAENGLDALKKFQKNEIVVTVSDIMMPDMDGITLLKKIRENDPEALVLFITANPQIESAIFAVKEGAFAYLRKPFPPEMLIDAVKNAVTKYNFIRQNKKFVEELHAAKLYNESIVRNLVYMVIATDLDGNIKKINHSTEKLLGYSESEIRGRPINTILSEDFLSSKWKELTEEKEVVDFAVKLLRKDGTAVSVLFSGAVMKDENGKPLGILGTAHRNPEEKS